MMKSFAAEEIAARALGQIGTPFRLHGRTPGVALDCAGLVAHAIGEVDVIKEYSLKGTKLSFMISYMDNIGLHRLDPSASIRDGDVAIVTCGPRQFHLMVRVADGWVHGHAGLRKVVHTPGASPWPVVAVLRMIGD